MEPDAIYVCPPGHFLAIRFGVLHLTLPLQGDHARLPIDFLIRSLAEECGARSVAARRSGASDFIERPVSRRELIDRIERAVAGASSGRSRDAQGDAIAQKLTTLTARQKDVLDLVMVGAPSKNIAADLGISQRTVEGHRAQIMQKLGVRTIPDLVRAVLSVTPAST